MVVCFEYCSVRKNEMIEKNVLKIRVLLEIEKTENRERLEQFLKQNTFLTCYWRFLRSNANWNKL